MKMRGLGPRHGTKRPYFIKRNNSWAQFELRVKKDKLEQKRKELANRPFEE